MRRLTTMSLLAAVLLAAGSGGAASAATPPAISIGVAPSKLQVNLHPGQVYKTDLDIDNNECERLLRGCCVGKKNYLFFGSEGGGEWGAVIYTLIESAKMNGHNPFAYLRDVLVRVSAHPMRRIEELMPRLWKPPDSS